VVGAAGLEKKASLLDERQRAEEKHYIIYTLFNLFLAKKIICQVKFQLQSKFIPTDDHLC